MKRNVLILVIVCFIALMIPGCDRSPSNPDVSHSTALEPTEPPNETPIKDRIGEINEDLLIKIASNYFISFGFDQTFAETDAIAYERAFPFIKYAGVYRMNPFNVWEVPELMQYYDPTSAVFALPVAVVNELIQKGQMEQFELAECEVTDDAYIMDHYFWSMRPELHRYFNKKAEILTVPAEIVDEYITAKFHTTIDHSQIREYDSTNDTYSFYPFIGEFYYDLLVEEISNEDNEVRFVCTATLSTDIEESSSDLQQFLFSISLTNGEYTYLSVECRNNKKP